MYIRRWRDEGVTLVTRVGGDSRASGIVIFFPPHFIVFKLYNNRTTCLKIVCQKERMCRRRVKPWMDKLCAQTGLIVNRVKTEQNTAVPKNIVLKGFKDDVIVCVGN